MNLYAMIFIGGGLGSLSRFGISRLLTSNFQTINPLSTLVSNIAATLILGVVMLWLVPRYNVPQGLKAGIVTGFCGGFSTFSTFSFETFELLRTGHYAYAVANVLVSILLGLLVLIILLNTQTRL